MNKSPRLSVRALIVEDQKILLVNATPDKGDGKWCVPGGGVDAGENIKDGLVREIYEETGLKIQVEDLICVSEFFDREKNFHQIDLFLKCKLTDGNLSDEWRDEAGVVEKRGFFTLEDMANMNVLPAFLKTDFWLKEDIKLPIYKGWEEKVSA